MDKLINWSGTKRYLHSFVLFLGGIVFLFYSATDLYNYFISNQDRKYIQMGPTLFFILLGTTIFLGCYLVYLAFQRLISEKKQGGEELGPDLDRWQN